MYTNEVTFTDVKMDDDNDDKSADVSINIRELDDVLMKDVGNKISDSGRYMYHQFKLRHKLMMCYL